MIMFIFYESKTFLFCFPKRAALKRRLRLSAPTDHTIGSGAALKLVAPCGFGSPTLRTVYECYLCSVPGAVCGIRCVQYELLIPLCCARRCMWDEVCTVQYEFVWFLYVNKSHTHTVALSLTVQKDYFCSRIQFYD